MTKEDYELIARAIVEAQDSIKTYNTLTLLTMTEQLRGVRRTAASICDKLLQENSAFDARSFLKACGYC